MKSPSVTFLLRNPRLSRQHLSFQKSARNLAVLHFGGIDEANAIEAIVVVVLAVEGAVDGDAVFFDI